MEADGTENSFDELIAVFRHDIPKNEGRDGHIYSVTCLHKVIVSLQSTSSAKGSTLSTIGAKTCS